VAATLARRNPAPASIQQTMLTKIDPASDALWASVGTVETARGTTHRARAARQAGKR
jgi:hypothetical protein